jgi:predicted phosphodiesterase
MRYGIFADVHSNLEALEAVINAYKNEHIDHYLCAGDVIGYAADPGECIEKIKALSAISVAGNHDWAAVDLFSADYFNPLARQAVLWTRDNLGDDNKRFLKSLKLLYKSEHFVMVHGTLNNPGDFNYMNDGYMAEETFKLLDADICFLGHTHVAGVFVKDKNNRISYLKESDIKEDNKYIVNVGSVGQPRDGNPKAAYCIYDTDRRKVKIKRIGYDIETAARRIIKAGLPRFLADRLAVGR